LRTPSALLLAAAVAIAAAQPQSFADTDAASHSLTGLDEQAVIELLGNPKGTVISGTSKILYYERGYVTLSDGKVVHNSIVSPAQLARRRAMEAEEAEERRVARAAAAAARKADGEAEKQARLSDAAFAQRSPADRVAYWTAFSKRFPEVSAAAELAAAQNELGETVRAETKEELAKLDREIAGTKTAVAEADRASRASSVHGSGKRTKARRERNQLLEKLAELEQKRYLLREEITDQ